MKRLFRHRSADSQLAECAHLDFSTNVEMPGPPARGSFGASPGEVRLRMSSKGRFRTRNHATFVFGIRRLRRKLA